MKYLTNFMVLPFILCLVLPHTALAGSSSPQNSQPAVTIQKLPCGYDLEMSGGEWIDAPAEFEDVTEWTRIGSPGHDRDIVNVPATYDADGNLISPAQVLERTPPPVYKWVTRRVVKTPSGRRKTPKRYVLRDVNGDIVLEFDHTFDISEFRDAAPYSTCFGTSETYK